jgi:hypothetical protein
MDIRDLFNVTTRQTVVATAAPAPGAAPQEQREGVFLTVQSIVTFPGATAAALLIWRVAVLLLPAWSSEAWVPFVISVAIGAFIWWIGISDPKAPLTVRDKIIRLGIAVLNTLQIFAAVLGLPH